MFVTEGVSGARSHQVPYMWLCVSCMCVRGVRGGGGWRCACGTVKYETGVLVTGKETTKGATTLLLPVFVVLYKGVPILLMMMIYYGLGLFAGP